MVLHGPATRAIREGRGLTVTGLAHEVGITQGHMSALESGKRKASPDVIVNIARALKCELAAVIRGPLDDKEVIIRTKRAA